ncbi:MAG: ABC transporter ATP-binding protein [Spirochaetaceae bacterium]|nr:ABC transporter ATP-binding protein [Spirochaetaceae bacterium]
METSAPYAVEMLNITKRFPGLIANDNISLKVKAGTVHALLGENGAGKSTLMSILFGLTSADSGQIVINGRPVKIKSPNQATALGIGMVHQHFKLIPSYSVRSNIILGAELTNKFGHIDCKGSRQRVVELSNKYKLNINPDAKVQDISVSMQQRVEILKVLYRNADIIVLDEPTAILRPQEIDELIAIIKRLQNEGKTLIFISHKLKEIAAAAQEVTIIRKGKYINTLKVADTNENRLAELMVGRPVKLELTKQPSQVGNEVLKLENLVTYSERGNLAVNNLSLTVRAGEIVGIAGVDGNGQRELVLALYGLLPLAGGRIYYDGSDITHFSTKQRIEAGMALSPEDRQLEGLVLPFTLAENLILKNFKQPPFSKRGFLLFKAIKDNAEKLVAAFDVRSAKGINSLAGELSGGNQQKLLLAREINSSPKLLIICQPTRGLDVGSIENIHKRILEERTKGVAILLISYELEEIMGLCDRIAAISGGHINAVLDGAKADIRQIGALMAGVNNEA